MLVVVFAAPNTIGAYAERQAKAPTDDARITMLAYHRSAPDEDEASDAWDGHPELQEYLYDDESASQ